MQNLVLGMSDCNANLNFLHENFHMSLPFLTRDTPGILALNFPTFATGRFAQDQRGRGIAVDFRVPVQMGQVKVTPGDIIVGDLDGVIAIPQEVEEEAIRRALEKASTENQVRVAIANGMTAVEAFEKFGVL